MSAAGRAAILETLAEGEANATEAPISEELIEATHAANGGSKATIDDTIEEMMVQGAVERVPEDEHADPDTARLRMSDEGRAELAAWRTANG